MSTAFPLRLDAAGRTRRARGDDWVRDLVEQVLFTSPGERVNRPTFGCGLESLLFEPLGPEAATAVRMQVEGSLQHWLSDVAQVEGVDVHLGDGVLRVEVTYRRHGAARGTTAAFTREVAA